MTLARRWSQAMGVLVAVGAVTGTVLSFEMGLLWPGLMRRYGPVIGLPFALEGIFFFLEAIFTAIYLYGCRRLRPWAHFWSGIPIAVSGIFGALSVMGPPRRGRCHRPGAPAGTQPSAYGRAQPRFSSAVCLSPYALIRPRFS
jgi:hypothetical protein